MDKFGLKPYSYGYGLAGMGVRNDGLGVKSGGYFGPLKTPEGDYATEYSVDFGKGDIPSLVPTLSEKEIQMVLNNDFTPEIINKIESHANYRNSVGKSPFHSPGELRAAPGALGFGEGGSLMKLLR